MCNQPDHEGFFLLLLNGFCETLLHNLFAQTTVDFPVGGHVNIWHDCKNWDHQKLKNVMMSTDTVTNVLEHVL